MASLQDYVAFVEIIDRGSLTAAAKHLGRSLQAVSHALGAMESELGVELIRRTTRRLHPTPAGLEFHRRMKGALAEIEHARGEASRESERVSGLFRIGAPVRFAPDYIAPAALTLLQRYPDLDIELVQSDAIADLVEEKLDVAIRIGDLSPPSLKIRRLASLRRVIVGSPDYLSRHGRPRKPVDLAQHACVVRTFGPEGDAWPVTVDGNSIRIPVRGAFRCNDAASANAAALMGAGLGMTPLWQVRAELDQGRLEQVLADYEAQPLAVNGVWVGNTATPARTRLFVDTVAARLAAERL